MSNTDEAHIRRLTMRAKASTIFTPSAPIDRLELFRGRTSQISSALEAISQIGQHPVIYGEAGVGKTSLASVLGEILERAQIAGWKLCSINCDQTDDFASLWRKVFDKLIVTETDVIITEGRTHQRELGMLTRLSEWLGNDVTPDAVMRVANLAQGHLIVIFDEFNQLLDRQDVLIPMANTVKTMSDNRVNATLVIVGVADSIDQLLAAHASTTRNFIQVPMPRMTSDEVRLIIERGLAELELTIDEEAVRFLQSLVHGLPAATHRIGLQCAYLLIDSERSECTHDDVKYALAAVVGQMPESMISAWDDATNSHRSDALFKQVLLACALTRRNELGWFSPADVLEPFQAVTDRRDYGISTYSQHLHLLADGRGQVLEKELRSSGANRYRFRFRDPLFQSFVVMHCLSHELLSEQLLDTFRANLPA